MYIARFTITTTYALIVLFMTTMSLGYFFKEDKDSFWRPVGKSVVVWLLLSAIYYGIIKIFNLEGKFI